MIALEAGGGVPLQPLSWALLTEQTEASHLGAGHTVLLRRNPQGPFSLQEQGFSSSRILEVTSVGSRPGSVRGSLLRTQPASGVTLYPCPLHPLPMLNPNRSGEGPEVCNSKPSLMILESARLAFGGTEWQRSRWWGRRVADHT